MVQKYFKKYTLKENIWNFSSFSNNKRIVFTSLIATIGIILKFIEVPTFSAFLKLDFALIPVMLLIFIGGTYPYVFFTIIIIDLVSLRGSIYGWIASLAFSLSFLNSIYFLSNLFSRKKNKISWFSLYSFISLIIATLFLFVLNKNFITPAFFGMTYEQISNPAVWSNISGAFFSIDSYDEAIFLFYSTFNFLLKGPVIIILHALIIIPLFYIRKINNVN